MSKKNKIDPRVLRTRRWLQEALLMLMQEKPYEQIQVAEITERAELSRPTFYLHYASKTDLLISCLDEIFINFQQEVSQLLQESETDDLTYCILPFKHWGAHQPFLRLVWEAGLETNLLERLREYVTVIFDQVWEARLGPPPHSFDAYVQDFIAGGFFLMLARWIHEEKPPSAEQMGRLFFQLVASLREGEK